MASNMDSLQESLTCPVCFEEFEENGDHVPRLLPCSHTLCHKCVGQWIRNNRLECPTCRMKHEARRDEISFPQNKYILTMMRRRTRLQGEQFGKCPDHEEDEVLFCRETGCQKTICILCLSKTHLGHKTVALKDETRDVLSKLLNDIEITSKELNKKIKKVEEVSNSVMKKTEANLIQVKKEKDKMIQELERKKEEMIKQYDGIIKQAEDEKSKLNDVTGNELTAMKENVVLLNNIKQSIGEEENTHDEALKKLDTVKGVKENIKSLPLLKKYTYCAYVTGQDNHPGKLVRKEKFIFQALELKGQVRTNIATGFNTGKWFGITALEKGTVAVCGEEDNQCKLKCFSWKTGLEVSSTNLSKASGMTEVEIRGRPVIAISHHSTNQIEFRNKENLAQIILTHSVAPHKPSRLCAVSSSVLVYSDNAKNPEELHWLDCSEAEPKPLAITANPNLGVVQDMCVAESENEKLLIVIARKANVPIQAFNSTTGQLKWSARKLFESFHAEADDNGRLYVTDITNNCIQMFSASDGQYLRSFMKRGDQGLGIAYGLRWCETTPSLVVGHHINAAQWLISDIH